MYGMADGDGKAATKGEQVLNLRKCFTPIQTAQLKSCFWLKEYSVIMIENYEMRYWDQSEIMMISVVSWPICVRDNLKSSSINLFKATALTLWNATNFINNSFIDHSAALKIQCLKSALRLLHRRIIYRWQKPMLKYRSRNIIFQWMRYQATGSTTYWWAVDPVVPPVHCWWFHQSVINPPYVPGDDRTEL